MKKYRMNRRAFLEYSSRITAGGVLLSYLPGASKKLTSIEGEIKVALVGCGGRGTGAASQALEADPGVHLVAMADVFPDRVDKCFKTLSENQKVEFEVGEGPKGPVAKQVRPL